MWTDVVIGCVTSLAASMLAVLVLRRAMPHVGLVDKPDGHRKTHRHPIPVGGGLAVFLATSLALCLVLSASASWRAAFASAAPQYVGLWVACLLITLLGLVDDAIQLRGRQKLLGQVLVSLVIVMSGICIRKVELFGLPLDFGVFAIPLTILWMIGTTNSLNLLDGIDGLATTIGIIISVALAVMAILSGYLPAAMICLVFAASLLGFLAFNFPPASIFLGDTGSMLIGTLIGALAIKASLKTPGTVLFAAPLAALAIPFLDSAAAIVRRKLTGRSLYSPDRDHVHHRLTWLLGDNRNVLAWLSAVCALTSFGGVVSVYLANDAFAAITVLAAFTGLVVFRLFGDSELRLLLQHATRFGRSFWESASTPRTGQQLSKVRFRGSMPWDRLWESLTETAEKLRLRRISLNINLWSLNEVYHAKWSDGFNGSSDDEWSLRLPLFRKDGQFGYVAVTGVRDGREMCRQVEVFLALIEPFEEEFRDWCGDGLCEAAASGGAAPGAAAGATAPSGRWGGAED